MRLRDKVFRRDVLWRAWISVQRNRGAPGIDQITLGHVEQYGVTRLLGELAAELGEGRYRGVADASGVHCEARHEASSVRCRFPQFGTVSCRPRARSCCSNDASAWRTGRSTLKPSACC